MSDKGCTKPFGVMLLQDVQEGANGAEVWSFALVSVIGQEYQGSTNHINYGTPVINIDRRLTRHQGP